jgi:ribosomal protein S18 acetylase RimI-like enzyme
MKDTHTKKILGYLSGCKNSKKALEKLEVPGFNLFEDMFVLYPAHLHINFHPDCRGRGLGSKLIEHYCEILRSEKIKGLHLVTSPEAKNVNFYLKLNFLDQKARVFGKSQLLFMGLKLC